MSHVYISYARSDYEFASWLNSQLRSAGINTWVDSEDIPAGFSWDQGIREALHEASLMLLVISAQSMISETVEQEWQQMLAFKKRIVPLIIDDAEIHFRLRSIRGLDFRQERDKAFQTLLQGLLKLGVETDEPSAKVVPSPQLDGEAHLRLADGFRTNYKFDQAVKEYLNALKDKKREDVRAAAIRALGEMRAQNDTILDFLRDPSVNVRAEAVIALARIGSEKSKLLLELTALQDNAPVVRLYAQIGVMTYSSRTSIPGWLNDLASVNTTPVMREAITLAQLRVNDLLDAVAPEHVFISYSRRDSEKFAVQLADSLRKTGFSVWIDTDLEPGTPVWMREIDKAIQQAGVCLVIISPAIHDSTWVPREVEFARQFDKRIIPIKYMQTFKPGYLITEQGLRDDLPFLDYPEQMLGMLVTTLDKVINRIR